MQTAFLRMRLFVVRCACSERKLDFKGRRQTQNLTCEKIKGEKSLRVMARTWRGMT